MNDIVAKEFLKVTPGKITALWQIIRLCYKYPDTHLSQISKIINNSGLRGGGLRFSDGLDMGITYQILSINKGIIAINDFTKNNLIEYINDIEPNTHVLRKILKLIIKTHSYPWMVYFSNKLSEFKLAIPNDWIELLENADLFNVEDASVLSWWESLFNSYNAYFDERNKKIGEVGEKLSVIYEINRLSKDLINNSNLLVKWVSKIDDKLGFDVISLKGSAYSDINCDEEIIFIEVKSSSTNNVNNFNFYLTRNEWETALSNINNYYFYCWTSVNTNEETAIGPYLVKAVQVKDYIPKDVDSCCLWWKCKFSIDLTTFILMP